MFPNNTLDKAIIKIDRNDKNNHHVFSRLHARCLLAIKRKHHSIRGFVVPFCVLYWFDYFSLVRAGSIASLLEGLIELNLF